MYTCKKCGKLLKKPELPCPQCGAAFSLTEDECAELMDEAKLNIKIRNYIGAFEIYALLSHLGYTDAERCYAKIFEEGKLVARDLNMAMRYYLAAAAGGDAYSAYKYSKLSENVRTRTATPDFWLCVAAIFGERRAFADAARLYNLREDASSANYYRALAADAGDISSAIREAQRNFSEGREAIAKWYLKKFRSSFIYSPTLYFKLFRTKAQMPPEPIFENRKKILYSLIHDAEEYKLDTLRFKLSELLAKDKDKDGLYNLGMLYAEGVGVKRSASEAMKLLDMSVSLGSAEAACALGKLLIRGELLPHEPSLGIGYYERAAELGDSRAYELLGDIYAEGELVEMDIIRAVDYYTRGARLGGGGCAEKRDALADERESYYERAIKSERTSPADAFACCSLAAAMGYIPAYSTLGSYFEGGIGTKTDRKSAYKWYMLGAKERDESATYNLGRVYARGIGVAFSYKKAVNYLTLAKRMGVGEAEDELLRLFENRKKKMLRSLFSSAARLYFMHKYEPSKKLFSLASQLGDARAAYTLGALAEFGLGEPTDRPLAAKFYNEAYEAGFIDYGHKYKKTLLKLSR